MAVIFLMSICRLYPGLKLLFKHNSVRKNLFLIASFYWHSRLFSPQMDQKFEFGGTIGYGDSYFEFLFRHFKVFGLRAIHAAGAIVAKFQATVT